MKNIKKYALALALTVPCIFTIGIKKSEAAKAIKNSDKAEIINVREEADEDSAFIGEIKDKTEYEITGIKGSWLEIDFEGKKGFVSSYWFDQVEDTKTVSPANFRKEPSLNSEIYEVLDGDTTVTILDIEDSGFVKVKYDDKTGYISLDLLEIYEEILEAQAEFINNQAQVQQNSTTYQANNYQASNKNSYNSYNNYSYQTNNSYSSYDYKSSSSNNNSQVSKNLISASTSGIYSYASQFVGNRYVWGGSSLTNGTDCSGFTQSVYSNYGVNLPHNAQAQYAYGENVSVNDAKEGDLVFYGTRSNNITHVAIADGNGGIVHAANPSTGITTGSIGNPIGVKRVAEETEEEVETQAKSQTQTTQTTETTETTNEVASTSANE